MKSESAALVAIDRFQRRWGLPHLDFAKHAAFPLAITPDLLYRLWATFGTDIAGGRIAVPWIAVSDVLLSPLCKEVGHELYEMSPAVQRTLLGQLRADPRFGAARIAALSAFVSTYYADQLKSRGTSQEFAQEQQSFARRVAIAYIDPTKAIGEFQQLIATGAQGMPFRFIATRLPKPLAEALESMTGTTPAPKPEPVATPNPPPAEFAGKRILWVDDSPANNAKETQHFHALGVTVDLVLNTQEALAALRSALTYDLVISDMERDGDRTAGLTLLADLNRLPHPPSVIIFAGYYARDRDRRLSAIRAGAYGCTNSSRELLELATAALRKEPAPVRMHIRDPTEIPPGSFCSPDEITFAVEHSGKVDAYDSVKRQLLIFSTKKQHTWLVATRRVLVFVLDDDRTRKARRLVQKALPISEDLVIDARASRTGGATVGFGRAYTSRWYYSPSLFADPGGVVQAINDMLHYAAFYSVPPQASIPDKPATSDGVTAPLTEDYSQWPNRLRFYRKQILHLSKTELADLIESATSVRVSERAIQRMEQLGRGNRTIQGRILAGINSGLSRKHPPTQPIADTTLFAKSEPKP